MNIAITRTTHPRQKPEMKGIRFGSYFSDHMFLMNYTEGKGWYDPRIVPYGTLELEPSAMVLGHEGLPHREGEHSALPPHGQY